MEGPLFGRAPHGPHSRHYPDIVADERPAEKPRLFDRMVQAGHASLSLALADGGGEPETDHERALVDAAVEAGVLGAIEVMRENGH